MKTIGEILAEKAAATTPGKPSGLVLSARCQPGSDQQAPPVAPSELLTRTMVRDLGGMQGELIPMDWPEDSGSPEAKATEVWHEARHTPQTCLCVLIEEATTETPARAWIALTPESGPMKCSPILLQALPYAGALIRRKDQHAETNPSSLTGTGQSGGRSSLPPCPPAGVRSAGFDGATRSGQTRVAAPCLPGLTV